MIIIDYKNQDDKTHKGMHNLSGVYIKEENHIKKNKLKLLGFSIIFPNQMRFYYADNEKDFNTWISIIRKVTGYSNLNSIYTLKVFMILLFRINWVQVDLVL